MANNSNGFMASSTCSSSSLKPRPFQVLPPVSGTKRKVYFASIDEEFDHDLRPPAKKFAGNSDIAKEGGGMNIVVDEEMESCENVIDEESDNLGNLYVESKKSDVKEYYYGKSIILSNEIQEILPQKWVSSDFPLNTRITDQVSQANSMALVLWKPTVIGSLDNLVWNDKLEKATQTSQCSSNLDQLPLLLTSSSLSPPIQSVEVGNEDDSVEMDITE